MIYDLRLGSGNSSGNKKKSFVKDEKIVTRRSTKDYTKVHEEFDCVYYHFTSSVCDFVCSSARPLVRQISMPEDKIFFEIHYLCENKMVYHGY